MKTMSYLLMAGLCLISLNTSRGAQTAQARLYCISVRLSSGMDEWGDVLRVTSTGGPDTGLGELVPYQSPGIDLVLPGTEAYLSNILLYDTGTGYTFGGSISTSIDFPVDQNNNRFPDFFEVVREVSNVERPYCMVDIYGYGRVYNVAVTWDRRAGSKSGTCVIAIDDGYFGTFHHTFEILEYTGTLSYTPGSNVVSGTLNLSQTGSPANTLQAPVQFTKSATDRYNELTLQPGVATGMLLSTVHSFTNHLFTRDVAWSTNYAGYFEFSDGDPFTFEPYNVWVLSINDSADADHDGIPDFSDDAAVPPPRRPALSLAQGMGNLQLTIRGDVGHFHEIQETISLVSPAWQTVQTIQLTSDPQTVTLSLPAGTRFWRVVAQ